MTKPNFFIIGAPKCGTTSLAHYLAQHPGIFIPDLETNFFCKDVLESSDIKNLSNYHALFEKAGYGCSAMGEKTALYLYSKQAVPTILEYNPGAKFIVMLRNPVDMVYSWHYQMMANGYQPIKNFKKAWELQEKFGMGLTKYLLRNPRLLQYGDICKTGQQINRLYSYVLKEKVCTILYDDLRNNPKEIYESVLSFLGIVTDNREHFPVYNEGKIVRSNLLNNFLILASTMREKLEIKFLGGIMVPLHRYNLIKQKRLVLPDDFRYELVTYFKKDIELLSLQINRDLSHWMQITNP